MLLETHVGAVITAEDCEELYEVALGEWNGFVLRRQDLVAGQAGPIFDRADVESHWSAGIGDHFATVD